MIRVEDNSSLRLNPKFKELFAQAEGRFLKDEEFDFLRAQEPQLAPEIDAARVIRQISTGLVKRVVAEIFSQYPYEKMHELAAAKCPRDVNYAVAYATLAMLARDPGWLDSKLLIWMKTILQAFDFPERNKTAVTALFADRELEDSLAKLPKKTRSIYHTYYRLQQEMRHELSEPHYKLIAPYLQMTLDTLTEPY